MAVESPAGVVKGVDTPAEVQRHVHQALAGAPIGAFAGGVGAVGMAHGICYPDAFKVTQSGTPGMSVDIAAGIAMATGTVSAVQGPYCVYNPTSITKSVAAANPTNPRRDLVVVRPLDPEFSGTPGVFDPDVFVVTGTPAAVPVDPSLAAYPDALVLYRVAVAAGATSITNANLTDLRLPARASAWYQNWGKVGYAERDTTQSTIPINATTDLTGLSVTWEAVAGRAYRVTGHTQPQPSGGNTITGEIRNGASANVGRWCYLISSAGIADGSAVLSGLTGTQTVKLSYTVSNSGSAVSNGASGSAKSFILVEDIGPA